MTEGKIKVVTGGKVIELTRSLMARDGVLQDVAYHKLCGMELYRLLLDPDTRLYLETDDYLKTACTVELDRGIDALYEFIKPDLS